MSSFIFNELNFDNHEQVIFVSEKKSNLRAIIAIHNTHLGPAMGGCRMWNYANEAAAIKDVLRLSRGMTYKNAVAGLPIGGGKSVIIGNPKTDKSPALFEAMGEALERLHGRYITAEDIGTSPDDMAYIAKRTQYVAGLGTSGDPSPLTALGCFVGAQAAIKHYLGRENFTGLTVALQGLGNVGYHYAKYLHHAGAKLVITDLDENRLAQARNEFDAITVETDAIYDVPADIYAPCAFGATLNPHTLERLKVKIIAGAANNQLATTEMGELLRRQEILYAPDFMINAGGIIKVCYEYYRKSANDVEAHVRKIGNTLTQVFQQADAQALPTSVIADRLAESHFQ